VLINCKGGKVGNDRERLSSLALIKDIYNTKMNLITNCSFLKDSITFIQKSREIGFIRSINNISRQRRRTRRCIKQVDNQVLTC